MKIQLSTSRIQTYLHCPKAYDWCYNKNLVPKKTTTALQIGSVVHELLQVFNEGKLDQEFIDHLPSWVETQYPLIEKEEALNVAAEAANLVLGYLRQYKGDEYEVVSPEVHLELDRGDYILYTRLDNLCRSGDGRLWRGEYKTTSRMDSAYLSGLKGGLQAGIAYLIQKEVMPERVHGTVYSILVKTKVPQYGRMLVPAEKTLLKMTEACVAGVVGCIKDAKFHPSMSCFYYNRECEYLQLCKNDSQMTREAFFEERKDYLPRT